MFPSGQIIGVTASSLVAVEGLEGAGLHEVVLVGPRKLKGEVVQLRPFLSEPTSSSSSSLSSSSKGGENNSCCCFIQMFDSADGIRVGDDVHRTGRPFCVEVGPGLLGSLFDGFQRPMLVGGGGGGDNILQEKGDEKEEPMTPSLSRTKKWKFIPASNIEVGCEMQPGDIFGHVFENELFPTHAAMVNPYSSDGGLVSFIAEPGEYTIEEELLITEQFDLALRRTISTSHCLLQLWPIYPSKRKGHEEDALEPAEHLVSGFRVFDMMFPFMHGGSGIFTRPCGGGTHLQLLSKYSNAQVVIYVACGGRETEMTEVVQNLLELSIDVGGGRRVPIKDRMVLFGSNSSSTAQARVCSVNAAKMVAEYYQAMGLKVLLLVDSISSWAEALSEFSVTAGTRVNHHTEKELLPLVSSSISSLFGSARRIPCHGSPKREGALSVIGSLVPRHMQGIAFEDPVVSLSLSLVDVLWFFDPKLAQRKQFPSVNWSISFSKFQASLVKCSELTFPSVSNDLALCKDILKREHALLEASQAVCHIEKESMNEYQKLDMAMAKFIRDDFLAQNIFSLYDSYCPFFKTALMLHNIALFYELCLPLLLPPASMGKIKSGPALKERYYTFHAVKIRLEDVFYSLSAMKFQNAVEKSEEEVRLVYGSISKKMKDLFYDLELDLQ